MKTIPLTRWFGGAFLALAVVCSTTPAAALPLAPPPGQTATPEQTPAPAPVDAVQGTDSITGTTDPSTTDSGTSSLPATPPSPTLPPAEPEPAPSPTPTPEPTSDPTAEADELTGPLGAYMGQGLDRIRETGNPQVAGQSEKADRAEAEAELDSLQVDADPAAATRSRNTAFNASLALTSTAAWQPAGIQGMDVSSHQPAVDWRAAWNQGSRFAYVKATEGIDYKNPLYNQQYTGAATVGMDRGAYHFALPYLSSGAVQANFFVNNGGGWSADGRTLPPLLDIEYNPYPSLGNTCYNMSAGQMVSWLKDFSNTVKARTGRVPMIYTTTDWWRTCTGNSAAFADHPLHIAAYNTTPGPMPAGWETYSVWQYSSTGPFEGDSNVWNGTAAALDAFVMNGTPDGGAIAAAAAANRTLGASTSGVICGLRDNGCFQNYQGGAVLWSPSTGAQLSLNGDIRSAYAESGFENGLLGYPTGPRVCGIRDGGCYQNFQGGAILWSPSTGSQLSLNGDIRNAYAANGFENSSLGYPTGARVCGIRGGGCYQNFQNGAIIWSPATGAQLSVNGAIRTAWQRNGFENGGLGYPTGPETCGLREGGCYQNFQGGAVTWTAGTGAHATGGEIRLAWQRSGFENGTLGYPVSAESCQAGTCEQRFQRGRITWSATTGAVIRR